MSKQQKPKPETKKGPNDSRNNGKAPKKNPKANNHGATGKTVGGYSPAAQERRSHRLDIAMSPLVKGEK